MAGDNFYGDVVNMHGGSGNQGIVHHHASPDLERALADVLARIEELRGQVEPEVAERLDGASAGLAVPRARRGGLVLLRDLAVTVGAIGRPLLDSIGVALQLLGP